MRILPPLVFSLSCFCAVVSGAESGAGWGRTEVDRFVQKKLEERGLRPQEEADRYALIRRVTAGLTGLPAAVEEVEAFVEDDRPDAYERLVERLLGSVHFGERWGRHWLDVARFGETDGILTVNEDKVRKDAWRYRDAVIRAMNADLPFDRFVRYQFCEPEEGERDDYGALRQFIHLGTRLQNNADPNDRQFHRLDDMVSTTGSAMLGFTFGCARCHDHPVDPMSTEEYYQFTAIFFDQFDEKPEASGKRIPLAITEPRVLRKGSWSSPGAAVEPGYLRVLMREPASRWRGTGRGEMEALADWLTDVEEGAGMRLARVMVNRLWHHHFGRGLVATPNDFGELGEEVSHPELLDWLAERLVEGGWRLKPVHRLMVTSATYRQAGASDGAAVATDADNRWLWQRRAQRLEAEILRDHLLAVAGVLRRELFGPSLPVGGYKKSVADTEESWRRSIYLQVNRTVPQETLGLFDPPDTERSVGSRSAGVAPEGALFALNAPLVWELAERFAGRVEREAGDDPGAQLRLVYLLALSRPPREEEVEIGMELLEGGDGRALTEYCHLIFGLNEFIYVQ